MVHLSSSTCTRVAEFPTNRIAREIEKCLVKFKDHLSPHRRLYQYLQPNHKCPTPNFYGLPKVHKPLDNGIPPVRPIVAHTNSLLSRLVDHVLQLVAMSYYNYLKNSTQLIEILEDLVITGDIILVTMDVTSLYPSIPQQECLNIVHSEMHKLSKLLILNPSLITLPLQASILATLHSDRPKELPWERLSPKQSPTFLCQ